MLTFARAANDPSLAFVHERLAAWGLFLNTPEAIAVDTPDRQFMVVALADSNGVLLTQIADGTLGMNVLILSNPDVALLVEVRDNYDSKATESITFRDLKGRGVEINHKESMKYSLSEGPSVVASAAEQGFVGCVLDSLKASASSPCGFGAFALEMKMCAASREALPATAGFLLCSPPRVSPPYETY